MRVLRGVHPIAASLTLMSAVTVVLWQVKINTTAHHLVYFYLLPIALIAVLYNGRTAVLCAAIALVVADYFLEDPIYSLVDNDLREFGDLGLVCTFGCNCDQSYSRIGATPHKNP